MSTDRAYGWNDTIEKPSEDGFTLLPEGTYPFEVRKLERQQFAGSAKMPACPKAVISINVDGGPLGSTTVIEHLMLHSKSEWRIAQFFAALGFRDSGEPVQMRWFDQVIGKRGRIVLETRHYKKKDGTEGEANGVKTWLATNDQGSQQPAPAPAFANVGHDDVPDDDIPF